MRGTDYNGSVPCPGCGTPLTPVEALFTDLCPACTTKRVRALVQERLTVPYEEAPQEGPTDV